MILTIEIDDYDLNGVDKYYLREALREMWVNLDFAENDGSHWGIGATILNAVDVPELES